MLKIPVGHKTFAELKGQTAQKFQTEFENRWDVFIVGCYAISKKDAMKFFLIWNNILEESTYIYLAIIDNWHQFWIRPYILDKVTSKGAFKTFKAFFELRTNHRQRNHQRFAELLDRKSLGQITKDDCELLSSQVKGNLSAEELKTFENGVHLYPKNEIVDRRNNEVLRWRY